MSGIASEPKMKSGLMRDSCSAETSRGMNMVANLASVIASPRAWLRSTVG